MSAQTISFNADQPMKSPYITPGSGRMLRCNSRVSVIWIKHTGRSCAYLSAIVFPGESLVRQREFVHRWPEDIRHRKGRGLAVWVP